MSDAAEPQPQHEAKIISGTEIAAKVTEELAAEVAKIKEATGTVPGLKIPSSNLDTLYCALWFLKADQASWMRIDLNLFSLSICFLTVSKFCV